MRATRLYSGISITRSKRWLGRYLSSLKIARARSLLILPPLQASISFSSANLLRSYFKLILMGFFKHALSAIHASHLYNASAFFYISLLIRTSFLTGYSTSISIKDLMGADTASCTRAKIPQYNSHATGSLCLPARPLIDNERDSGQKHIFYIRILLNFWPEPGRLLGGPIIFMIVGRFILNSGLCNLRMY